MRIYQQCSNAEGWTVVDVDSSKGDKVYKVAISEYDYICDCRGFEFNGKCKHRALAEQLRCRWEEGELPCQSEVERRSHTCPLCGSQTILRAEDDGETED